MDAVVVVGHGSLRRAAGADMIRLTALLRRRHEALLTAPGFLNFSRPTFSEAVARLVAQGATRVVVQPYFLIDGYYVGTALPNLVSAVADRHPRVAFALADPLGYHRALVDLVALRACEAGAAPEDEALLLLAHGTPDPAANDPIHRIVDALRSRGTFKVVETAFLELNEPTIAEAVAGLAAAGARRVTAVPYFLQYGGHVADDLPARVTCAAAHAPATTIVLADRLGFHPLLLEVIEERLEQANAAGLDPACASARPRPYSASDP